MFAVMQTGGKQYRVAVGQSLQIEKLPAVKGDVIEFERVLLVSDGDQMTAGTPLVEGARVVATVSRQERGPKLIVFRYKSKKRVRVKRGHRQSLTQVFIRDITVNGESVVKRDAIAATPEAAAEPAAATEPGVASTPESEAEAPLASAQDSAVAEPEAATADDQPVEATTEEHPAATAEVQRSGEEA